MFHPIMTLYHELTSDTVADYESAIDVGDPLLDLVQDDWTVFSSRVLASGRAGKLLEILANAQWDDDSGESPFEAGDLYTRRRSWSHETLQQALDSVIAEIDGHADDRDIQKRLADALGEQLHLLSRHVRKGTRYYRGRPGHEPSGEPFSGAAIGAPPAAHATAGRASPAGVSVLYLAREEETVKAELRARAPVGPLSVCTVRATRNLKVLDLVRGYPGINPFTSSEESLFWEVEVADLLVHFGSELSQPVQSDDDPHEYTVTQQLCEAVRLAGYDGILYPSTRHDDGLNLVVFEPGALEIEDSWLVAQP
jgi:hypothetical protein